MKGHYRGHQSTGVNVNTSLNNQNLRIIETDLKATQNNTDSNVYHPRNGRRPTRQRSLLTCKMTVGLLVFKIDFLN